LCAAAVAASVLIQQCLLLLLCWEPHLLLLLLCWEPDLLLLLLPSLARLQAAAVAADEL